MKKIPVALAFLSLAVVAAPAAAEDPHAVLERLEARLLQAQRIELEVQIESNGAVQSNFEGRAELGEANRIELAFAGQFAGQPQELLLKSNGRAVTLGNSAGQRREEVDAESNRAVLIGLVRMGLLHNLARLTALRGPDRAEGGAEEWVTLENFRQTTYAIGGDLDGAMSVGFDVAVNGTPAATARLWFDPDTGLPLRREQTVRFAQGEMTVIERYNRFVLE
jgi:hypothetical protein